jgi:predicted enzyme related to lactoylglutathione lyase
MTANDVAFELFQFVPGGPDAVNAAKPGYFHTCLVSADIEALACRIQNRGGSQLSPILPLLEYGVYRMCYCADPFGNVIELYSHGHEVISAGDSE